jgi:hypothetical protein
VPALIKIEGPEVITITGPGGVPMADVEGARDVNLVIDSPDETTWRILATAPDETAVAFTLEANVSSPARVVEAST